MTRNTPRERQSPVIFYGDQIDILNWFHNSTSTGYLITSLMTRRCDEGTTQSFYVIIHGRSIAVYQLREKTATCFSALCLVPHEKISHDILMSIARDNAIKHVLCISIVPLNFASLSSVSKIFERLYATTLTWNLHASNKTARIIYYFDHEIWNVFF